MKLININPYFHRSHAAGLFAGIDTKLFFMAAFAFSCIVGKLPTVQTNKAEELFHNSFIKNFLKYKQNRDNNKFAEDKLHNKISHTDLKVRTK